MRLRTPTYAYSPATSAWLSSGWRGSRRSCLTGGSATGRNARVAPTAAATSVGRRPTVPAKTPPISPPSGTSPQMIDGVAPTTRPWSRCGRVPTTPRPRRISPNRPADTVLSSAWGYGFTALVHRPAPSRRRCASIAARGRELPGRLLPDVQDRPLVDLRGPIDPRLSQCRATTDRPAAETAYLKGWYVSSSP